LRVDEFLQDFHARAAAARGRRFFQPSRSRSGIGWPAWRAPSAAWRPSSCPVASILVVLASLYLARGLTPSVATLMHGMSAAVVGLVAVTTLRMARPTLVSARAIAIAAATFAAVGLLKLNTPASSSSWPHSACG